MMMSISAIIGQVNGPLSQLIGFLQQFQEAKISLERSEEVQLCTFSFSSFMLSDFLLIAEIGIRFPE